MKPLYHMVRRTGTGDTVLDKSREMTGRGQTLTIVTGGRRGEDKTKTKQIGPVAATWPSSHGRTSCSPGVDHPVVQQPDGGCSLDPPPL